MMRFFLNPGILEVFHRKCDRSCFVNHQIPPKKCNLPSRSCLKTMLNEVMDKRFGDGSTFVQEDSGRIHRAHINTNSASENKLEKAK